MAERETTEITDEHPDVVDDIDAMYAEAFGGDEDLDDLADDAALRAIRDASERCGMAGIPHDDRVDVIMAGIRQFLERQLDEELENTRWTLDMMFSL